MSGFASRVISILDFKEYLLETFSRNSFITSGSSKDGVPPPKKIVSITRSWLVTFLIKSSSLIAEVNQLCIWSSLSNSDGT